MWLLLPSQRTREEKKTDYKLQVLKLRKCNVHLTFSSFVFVENSVVGGDWLCAYYDSMPAYPKIKPITNATPETENQEEGTSQYDVVVCGAVSAFYCLVTCSNGTIEQEKQTCTPPLLCGETALHAVHNKKKKISGLQ